MRLLLALTVSAITAAGQTPVTQRPQSQTTPGKAGAITGIVVDKLTRKPLPKASINALSAGQTLQQATATTATDGSFALNELVPGNYRLTISARGYVTNTYGTPPGQSTVRTVTVEEGKAPRVEIEMVPHGVISGRVVTRTGEPVVNASIGAAQLTYPGGKRRLMSRTGNIFTNDRGEYRIPGLAPGTYYITAIYLRELLRKDSEGRRLPAAEDRSAIAAEALLPTIYPGVADDTGAVPINVVAGQEVQGINVVMLQAPTVSVSGRVRDESGDPKAKISVELRRGGAFEGYIADNSTAPRPDGTFELRNVPPGSYTLSVTSPLPLSRTMETALPLLVTNKTIADLDLRLTAGVNIPGRLRTEEEGDKNFQLSGHNVTLGWAGIRYAGRLPANSDSAADGTFTLEHVNTGDYFVTVSNMPQSYYIKAAHLGGTDILETGTTITSSAPGELDVVVSAKGAKLTGIARDSKGVPVPIAQVVLVPDNPARRGHAQWYRATNANASGDYTLEGIAPGVYKVFAWTNVPNQAWYNADFMRPLEGRGVRLTISDGGSSSADVEVLP